MNGGADEPVLSMANTELRQVFWLTCWSRKSADEMDHCLVLDPHETVTLTSVSQADHPTRSVRKLSEEKKKRG